MHRLASVPCVPQAAAPVTLDPLQVLEVLDDAHRLRRVLRGLTDGLGVDRGSIRAGVIGIGRGDELADSLADIANGDREKVGVLLLLKAGLVLKHEGFVVEAPWEKQNVVHTLERSHVLVSLDELSERSLVGSVGGLLLDFSTDIKTEDETKEAENENEEGHWRLHFRADCWCLWRGRCGMWWDGGMLQGWRVGGLEVGGLEGLRVGKRTG